MSGAVELLLAACAYALLREHTGRADVVFVAAAQVYRRSHWGAWTPSVSVPPECMPRKRALS